MLQLCVGVKKYMPFKVVTTLILHMIERNRKP